MATPEMSETGRTVPAMNEPPSCYGVTVTVERVSHANVTAHTRIVHLSESGSLRVSPGRESDFRSGVARYIMQETGRRPRVLVVNIQCRLVPQAIDHCAYLNPSQKRGSSGCGEAWLDERAVR